MKRITAQRDRHLRVRCLALALVACAACVDDTGASSGLEGVSHVDVHELPGRPPQQVDLLFVIDDTTAMAPYQDRLASLATIAAQELTAREYGFMDVRIAVASNDGVLRTNDAVGGSFLTMRVEEDLSHTTNFYGTLADALQPLMNVGSDAAGPSTPLAALRRVIEENPAGFVRPNAYLGILIVSGDDASPGPVTEYAQLAKSSKLDPAAVHVLGIVGPSSTRLDAFFAEFPNRNSVISIDGDDYAAGFAAVPQNRSTFGLPCMNASDVDPDTPGAQYDCTFTFTVRGAQRLARQCTLPGEQFCWSLEAEPECFVGPDGVTPRIPPFSFNGFHPAMRTECVVFE